MAKVTAKKVVQSYTVEMDVEEAGYLLELLMAHVGGTLMLEGQPLGNIRIALEEAGVERIEAENYQRVGFQYAALRRVV